MQTLTVVLAIGLLLLQFVKIRWWRARRMPAPWSTWAVLAVAIGVLAGVFLGLSALAMDIAPLLVAGLGFLDLQAMKRASGNAAG